MRELLSRVQKEWQKEAPEPATYEPAATSPLLFLTARCAVTSPRGIACLLDEELAGERLYFAPPARSGETSFAVVGRGEAVRVAADGRAALSALTTASTQLFSSLIEHRGPGCEAAPSPRLYGGLRFDRAPIDETPNPSATPWRPFADASFVLPRWLLLSDGEATYLQLAVEPAELRHSASLWQELQLIESLLQADTARPSTAPPLLVREKPAPADETESAERQYCALVRAALAEISAGSLRKVVAARQLQLEADRPFSIPSILGRLDDSYSDCQRFAIEREGAVFVGATPELLIARQGRKVVTEALAGTRPRVAGSDEHSVKQDLLADDKERREHDLVIGAIVESLQPSCARFPTIDPTQVRSLRNVHHLWTPIRGELATDQHVLALLLALHPTPAVCGLPASAAARFLSTHEHFDRGYYAAPVGHFDGHGNGEFWVAIRSALVCGQRAWLYAGAGVVVGSSPESEYRETAVKLAAMRAALGAS